MKANLFVILCVVISFGLGYYLHKPDTRIVTKEIKVPFLDMTVPDIEQRLSSAAAFLNKVLIDKDEFEGKQAIIEKNEHKIWQNGYEEGYRANRQW